MKSRRILLTFLEPPAPFGNAAARWFAVLLRDLVERGHSVTAFAACGNKADMEQAKDLFPAPTYDLRCYQYSDVNGLAGKWRTLLQPYSYPFNQQIRNDLNREIQSGYDVLHLEQLWSGWLGLRYARAVVNVHYLVKIDLAHRREHSVGSDARFLLACQAERRLLRSFHNICTLSSRLSSEVSRINRSATVHTIPLCLDLDLYRFDASRGLPKKPIVTLIGSFSWEPTFSAAVRLSRLWPRICKQVAGARLQVVGRQADRAAYLFQSADNVQVISDVIDILPFFNKSDLLIYAPATGSGMKVKVMEAFALGVPVVTNADGIEGTPAIDGVHAGVSETDDGLVSRAVALLTNPVQWQSQRTKARELLVEALTSHRSISLVEDMHGKVMGGVC